MKRDLALAALARHRTDQIVVSVYHSGFDWRRIAPHPLNFYSVGAMGLASSNALGLALGRPDKQVIVLDGDGSLLMNLGSLVTIAAAAPANLIHFVCENGTYEANGAVPIPGQGQVHFAGLARAAGYREAHEFSELSVFEAALPALLKVQGPVFITLKVEPGEASLRDYAFVHGEQTRADFRSALRASRPR